MTASATWTNWSCLVRLTVDDPACLPRARLRLEELMADVGQAANRFDPDSDISRINAHAGQLVSVGSRTIALVDAALDAAALTGGAVDPTVGLHVAHSGYADDIEQIRGRLVAIPADDAAPPPRQADWTRVQMNHELRQIGVPHGIALDLGATAKSFTADLASLELAAALGTGVLVEIGGDLSVSGPRIGGWTVAVSESPDSPRQFVTIGRGGVATSSTTARRWRTQGGDRHHIIDPRTGLSATGPWRTVTVWSSTALQANTASTAAIVLGDEAEAYLNEMELSGRLIGHDGTVVTTGGWPAERKAA